nr:hypothetical protein [Burkholderia cenocepacia]
MNVMSTGRTGKRAIVPRFIAGRLLFGLRRAAIRDRRHAVSALGRLAETRRVAETGPRGLLPILAHAGGRGVLFSALAVRRQVFHLQAFYLRSAQDALRTLARFASGQVGPRRHVCLADSRTLLRLNLNRLNPRQRTPFMLPRPP